MLPASTAVPSRAGLYLLLPLLFGLLFVSFRSCATVTSATLPRVSTTKPPPPKPRAPGGAVLPAVGLSKCPGYVQRVVHHLRKVEHYNPLANFKGGKIFENYKFKLPRGKVYREYDVHPYTKGINRGNERIVMSADKRNFYYTTDHYETFIPILLP